MSVWNDGSLPQLGLTLLYDANCPICRRFRDWLDAQPKRTPVHTMAAGSDVARRTFPTLDHTATLREITVVGDDGAVWTHERAWVMCLWATVGYRALAERLATPTGLPLAKATATAAAGLRHLTSGSVA